MDFGRRMVNVVPMLEKRGNLVRVVQYQQKDRVTEKLQREKGKKR